MPDEGDVCQGVTCSGHGTCMDDNGTAVCNCDTGYHAQGLNCVPDEGDVCQGVTCSGHGICTDDNGTAVCYCDTGYHAQGLNCVPDEGDVCQGVTCSYHGTCMDDNGTAVCNCDTGYHAQGLTCVPNEGVVCQGVTCSGHGICIDDNGTAVCDCDTGYHAQGTQCIQDSDGCTDDLQCPLGMCVQNLSQGYCSGECEFDFECSTGMHCFFPRGYGFKGLCLYDCITGADDCPDLLTCRDGDDDQVSECLPDALDVGQACTSHEGCYGTYCTTGTDLATYYPDGYCMASCISGQPCPENSHCMEVTFPLATHICVRDCTLDSDCERSSYECQDGDGSLCLAASPTPVWLDECDSDYDCRLPDYACRDLGLNNTVCFKAL